MGFIIKKSNNKEENSWGNNAHWELTLQFRYTSKNTFFKKQTKITSSNTIISTGSIPHAGVLFWCQTVWKSKLYILLKCRDLAYLVEYLPTKVQLIHMISFDLHMLKLQFSNIIQINLLRKQFEIFSAILKNLTSMVYNKSKFHIWKMTRFIKIKKRKNA